MHSAPPHATPPRPAPRHAGLHVVRVSTPPVNDTVRRFARSMRRQSGNAFDIEHARRESGTSMLAAVARWTLAWAVVGFVLSVVVQVARRGSP